MFVSWGFMKRGNELQNNNVNRALFHLKCVNDATFPGNCATPTAVNELTFVMWKFIHIKDNKMSH